MPERKKIALENNDLLERERDEFRCCVEQR
jgi:hypothetical protein